jgi:hypothetical protein
MKMEDTQEYSMMLKNLIIEEVAAGIKGTQLAVNIPRRIFEDSRYEQYRKQYNDQGGDGYIAVVNELVENGDIIEVEYVLSNMPHTIKSFYLPAGTVVTVVT